MDLAVSTIQRYDTSCQGYLDFDDFLNIAVDLEPILEQNYKDNPEVRAPFIIFVSSEMV
jgi:hypothetical protein